MNAYAWYFKALEMAGDCGELSREQLKALGISEGDPQPGFYRKRAHKDGPFVPVAIWSGAEGLVALANGEIADPMAVWTFCARNPIKEDTYHAVLSGQAWRDEPPAIGHNSQSDDPHEQLTAEYQGEAETAATFLKTPITTQEQADRAAVWSKRLATIAKKATDLHKVEKQPSLDEGRRVDDRWRDLKDGAAELSKRLKRHMDAFLQEQDRLEQERQRKARDEADRIRREAEAAAFKAAQADNDTGREEADRLAKQAADAEREAEARNSSAGRTGAKVALRTFVSARVVDYDKAHAALKNHPEMKALVETLANRAVKAGVDLDGVERFEEKRAA